jgi:DNA repair protein RecN (Recombination protein N)
MINRVFIKELLGFNSINLEFERGLIVITGPSGAGKSVFMGAILANFGFANQEAKLCEVELSKPKNLSSELFDLEDDIVIKAIKKDRVRFFLNEQNISKRALKELFKEYVSYISVRDKSGFESEKLLELIDNYIDDSSFKNLKSSYIKEFKEYQQKSLELKELKEKIKASNDRLEFLKFEIEKIEKINPKEGEYEELLKVKKQLSKLDKIKEIALSASEIFNYEDSIYELFNMLDKDSSYFNDAMNTLRGDIEDIEALSEDLADIDIEEVLNRLEDLEGLNRRFGSIKEALEYLEAKREELITFENIESNLSELESNLSKLEKTLIEKAAKISKKREAIAKRVQKELAKYLKELKLPAAQFKFKKQELSSSGVDEVSIFMDGVGVESLSGGEFNRVRLALLTVFANSSNEGVIILDEIDANVSGDESIAIANMISKLSKSFQIFAISHQPHLSSKANTHILVNKKDGKSEAKVLNKEQRVNEIARIIGGESFNKESLEFAKKVLETN